MIYLNDILHVLKNQKLKIRNLSENFGYKEMRFYKHRDRNLHIIVEESSSDNKNALEREIDFRVLLEELFNCQVRIHVLDSIRKASRQRYLDNSISIESPNRNQKKFFDNLISFNGLDEEQEYDEDSFGDNWSMYLNLAKKRLSNKNNKVKVSSLIEKCESKMLSVFNTTDDIIEKLPPSRYPKLFFYGCLKVDDGDKIKEKLFNIEESCDEFKRVSTNINLFATEADQIVESAKFIFRQLPFRYSGIQQVSSSPYYLNVKNARKLALGLFAIHISAFRSLLGCFIYKNIFKKINIMEIILGYYPRFDLENKTNTLSLHSSTFLKNKLNYNTGHILINLSQNEIENLNRSISIEP